jgi:hypothetical protein
MLLYGLLVVLHDYRIISFPEFAIFKTKIDITLMKKHLTSIPAYLLGALFLFGGISYFFMEPPQDASLNENAKQFFGLLMNSGYMNFVKIFEIIGAALLFSRKTRLLGLGILGAIILNIAAYEIFIAKAPGIGIVLLLVLAIACYFEKEKLSRLLN